MPRAYRNKFLSVLLRVGMLTGSISCASAEEGAPSTDRSAQEASAAQMKAMQRRAASLDVRRGKEEPQRIELVEAALLRYSSPGGDTGTADGSIWAWGKRGRPAALTAVFFQRLAGGNEKWSCELLSLSEGPVAVESAAGWKWTPARSELRWHPVSGAPAVAENEAERGRQMKDLARRFTASATYHEGRTDQLRLMIRAIHRYADPDNGLIDGAIYAFASGTNPEALLLLEARSSGGRAAWHFSFARMGAGTGEARLDDKIVWECPAIKAWESSGPYFSVFGPDSAVFGAVPNGGE